MIPRCEINSHIYTLWIYPRRPRRSGPVSPLSRIALFTASMLLATSCTIHGALSQPPGRPLPAKPILQETDFAQQVVALTNHERASYKLEPLTLQSNLTAAAHWMARDLATMNYFAHVDHLGRGIDKRFAEFGYSNWHTLGENIAGGQQTPAAVVESWMHSPGHRKNILTPSFREIGIGYCATPRSKLKRYWVQDFGSRL